MKKILPKFLLILLIFASGFLIVSLFSPSVFAGCDNDQTCRQRDGNRPYCDRGGQGTCVQCTRDGQCNNGRVCKQGNCEFPGGGSGGGGGGSGGGGGGSGGGGGGSGGGGGGSGGGGGGSGGGGGGSGGGGGGSGGGTGGGTGGTGSGADDGLTGCSNPDSTDPACFTEAVTSAADDCTVPGTSVPNSGTMTELGICIPKDPAGFAQAFYRIGLGSIGGLSIIFIIFGGYQLLTSQGNPDKLNNGKKFIFYALFGLLLTIFGYVFIEVIAIDILRLPGFTR